MLVELGLALYSAVTAIIAFQQEPGLCVLMAMYALGFAYVGGLSVWQARANRRLHGRERRSLELSENKL